MVDQRSGDRETRTRSDVHEPRTWISAFINVKTFKPISIPTRFTKTFIGPLVINTSCMGVTSVLHSVTVININAMLSVFDITINANTSITPCIINTFHMLATMMSANLALVNVIATNTITSESINTFTNKRTNSIFTLSTQRDAIVFVLITFIKIRAKGSVTCRRVQAQNFELKDRCT